MRPHAAALALLAGLAPLLASIPALAADWYVDAAAAAGGDGSQAKPFPTINAALAGLARGDTVWLATGTYDEVVNITKLSGTGTTTLRAVPGATPVIDGTSGSSAAGFVIQTDVPSVTFQDLTIQNAMNGALGIQFYHADGGQVIHCVTRNMSSNAVTFYYANQGTVRASTCQGNIAGRQTTGTVVEGNEVYGSSAEGVGLYDGSTGCTVAHNVIHDNFSVNLYLDSISHSTFDGNLIYETDPGNDLEGIEISDEGHYADLPAPVNSYNTIVNNVIVGHNLGIVFWYSGEWSTQALNDQSGLRHDVISNNTLVNNKGAFKWDASPAHVGTTIENNVIVAAAGTSPIYLLQAKSAGGITLDHNLWFAPDLPQPFLWVGTQTDHAGFVAASGQGGGDVLADPGFAGPWAAPPATNLELAKGSPAIGQGATLAAVIDDFLGAPRPATGTDIGAFQYGAVAPADGGVGPPGDAGGGGGPGSSSSSSGGGGSHAGSGGSGGGSSVGKSGGCGCGVAGDPPAGAWLAGLFALVALSRRRLRRAFVARSQIATPAFSALVLLACGSGHTGATAGVGGGGTGAGANGGTGGTLPGTNACPSLDNPPGASVLEIPWPIANGVKNDGYDMLEGDSAHVAWTGGATQNVFQIPLWTSPETDSGWANELHSGALSATGALTWNTGTFPCGYRPGLYFLADGNPVGIAAAVSLTVDPTKGGSHYAEKPCSALSDPIVYQGRYAKYASRPACKQYEVNNFMTETHYDWLSGTGTSFGLTQGDLLLFRWSNEHNIVQAHDQSQDQPVPGGIVSGNRTNCVPGPNYTCVNGTLDLGEYMIDTTDHRPGVIHLTDQCTYGCAACPKSVACDNISTNTTGTTFEVLLRRPVRPAPPTPGACCAIDKTKGQACRVVDVYNDNDGTQFDTGLGGGLTVNRGDLVRFRWAGAVKIVQVMGGKDGAPSMTPMPNGVAMPASVDCVPGPSWTCLLGMTDQAQLVVDVDQAVSAGHFETFSYSGTYLNFYAFADNSQDPFKTTQDSAILLPIANATPYANNPACP